MKIATTSRISEKSLAARVVAVSQQFVQYRFPISYDVLALFFSNSVGTLLFYKDIPGQENPLHSGGK